MDANSNFYFYLLSCSIVQIFALFISIEISKLFGFKIIKNNLLDFYSTRRNLFFCYFLFLFLYVLVSMIFFYIKGHDGLQISNLIFFLLTILETFLKVGQSERFLQWLGREIDKTIISFMMFVISLNVIYFLTRITAAIIKIK